MPLTFCGWRLGRQDPLEAAFWLQVVLSTNKVLVCIDLGIASIDARQGHLQMPLPCYCSGS